VRITAGFSGEENMQPGSLAGRLAKHPDCAQNPSMSAMA
jgi:hypothetical protein